MGRPLSRAAIVFASAAAVSGCSSPTTPPEPKDASADTGQAVAAYGVAVQADAGDAGGSTSFDAQPHYGVVVMPDEDGGQSTADYGAFVNPDSGN